MHTLSSARRTCMASASAVECTATVATPSSLQARSMRRAISPRLAIRILSNIVPRLALLDHRQRVAIFDRLAVLEENGDDGAGAGGGDLVHGLHGFNDEQRLPGCHLRADLDERRRARLGRTIGGAHHRRGHRAGMDDELLGPRCGPRVLSRFGLGDVGGECGRKVHPTRDPDPFPLVFDLNLGETGLLEKRREFADQVLVEAAPLLRHGRRPLPSAITSTCRPQSWRPAPRSQARSLSPRSRRSHPSRPWRYKNDGETARGGKSSTDAPRPKGPGKPEAHPAWRSR